MKTKFLFCLALILAVCTGTAAPALGVTFIVKTNWTDTTVILYRAKDRPIRLPARQATVTEIASFATFDLVVTAFVDPKTGSAWLGADSNFPPGQQDSFYFETTEGIFSGRILFMASALGGIPPPSPDVINGTMASGEVQWWGNLVPSVKRGETMEDVINQCNQKGYLWVVNERGVFSPASIIENCLQRVENGINPWLFIDENRGPKMRITTIERIKNDGGKLRVDLRSPNATHQASVWIDPDTWKVVKATQDGQSFFPPDLQSIHMIDRKNGWALTGSRRVSADNWRLHNDILLRTTDGGKSWKTVLATTGSWQHLAPCFYDSKTAWAAAYDEEATTNLAMFRTTDGGRTWKQSPLSQPHILMNCSLSFPSTDKGWLMVIPDHGMNFDPGDLYETTNGGASWQLINSTEASPRDWIWENAALPEFMHQHPYLICGGAVTFKNNSTGWLLGSLASTSPSYLFMSRDGGRNWQVQSLPLPAGLHHGEIRPVGLPNFFAPGGEEGILPGLFIPADSWATNFATVIYTTRNGGLNWQATAPVKFQGVWNFISAQKGYNWSSEPHNTDSIAPVKGTLYSTRDGGNSWEQVPVVKGLDEYLKYGQDITQLDFVNRQCGWALRRNITILRQLLQTTDGGETWNSIQTTIPKE